MAKNKKIKLNKMNKHNLNELYLSYKRVDNNLMEKAFKILLLADYPSRTTKIKNELNSIEISQLNSIINNCRVEYENHLIEIPDLLKTIIIEENCELYRGLNYKSNKDFVNELNKNGFLIEKSIYPISFTSKKEAAIGHARRKICSAGYEGIVYKKQVNLKHIKFIETETFDKLPEWEAIIVFPYEQYKIYEKDIIYNKIDG